MELSTTVTLHNGVAMPRLGLGVFKSPAGNETENAVRWALETGYRHIDTAMIYRNEESVGAGIRAANVPREEIFITTKVWNDDQGYDTTLAAYDDSLKRLGVDRVDLYLVHWPVKGSFVDTYRALEHLYREKRVDAIGVSNFQARHLEALERAGLPTPTVNQVELHPYLQQKELREYCAARGIIVEAWSPIARGRVLEEPLLTEIGARYGKSAVHVTLRWELQHGLITIPKSVTEARIHDNAQVWDFALTDEEMAAIDTLDRGEEGRIGSHPDTFSF